MRDRSTLLTLLIVAVVVAVTVFADDLAPDPAEPATPTAAVAVEQPAAGSWVCGVGEPGEDRTTTTVAARPGGPGDPPAQVELQRFTEGDVDVTDLPSIFPGAEVRVSADEDDEQDEPSATWTRWRDGPVAAWREWRFAGDDDVPDVTIAGGCSAPSSPTWVVPGMSTEGGDEAQLRLSNPFGSAATVAVSFLTPEGVEDPLVLQNLTVPAGSVRDIVVNESLPEEPDLAAVVEVATGRLSVEGFQLSRAEIGDIDGGSLLAAAPRSSEEWTVPWVAEGDGAESWLWIANPGESTAPVELTLHTADGGEVPNGLAEVSVPPDELRRVDLGGTFPEDVEVAGVTARSNGVPVVVSAGTRVSADEPEETGIAVQLGAEAPDASWVVAGGPSDERDEDLHLVNPTATDATVDVEVFDGAVLLEPSDLQGIEVPAGSSRVLELAETLDGTSGWSAFVTASEGELVVGRVGRNVEEDEPLRLVAAPGVSAGSWMPDGSGLATVASEGLVSRLRTEGGAGAEATIDPSLDEDDGIEEVPDGDLDPDDDPDEDVAEE